MAHSVVKISLMSSYQEATNKTNEELYSLLKTTANGLSGREADDRRRIFGLNAISLGAASWHTILLRQFRSSFVYLLFAAAFISLFMRDFINAVLIFIFLLFNVFIGFLQENKAEKSVALLKNFIQWRARVKRDGKFIEIDTEELVPGDIVHLQAGDMIPADGRFICADGIIVDESVLTGESINVSKTADPLGAAAKTFYDAKNYGFFRTTISAGSGELAVCATGGSTAVGAIAKQIQNTHTKSGFEIGISRFSGFILKLVLVTIVFMVIGNLAIHKGKVDLSRLLIFAIALTVGVVPEALPLVTSLSMSQGAVRLAKKHVVPRRLSAIEDLGSIEVLCTDKTGTITENSLTVAEFYGNKNEIMFFALAGAGLQHTRKLARKGEDVFDLAIFKETDEEMRASILRFNRVSDLPFDPMRRCDSALLVRGDERMIITRGAPEAVLARSCGQNKQEILDWARNEGVLGRRVLAFAKKQFSGERDEITTEDENGEEFIGMVSFRDPLKRTAKNALKDAKKLGLMIKIITGDSREVAGAVAYEARLIDSPDKVITGDELLQLPFEKQNAAVEEYSVFARATPLQKYHIIELLQKKFLVGFLGEGFNDAPALKLAHVGLAVNGASDIAREASDIVLLNKSLHVIVEGIREGRKISANTIKYIKATLTSNFGNFYALAFASLIIDYPPMLPVQILLLNLLTDFPMISIASDSVDEREVERPRGYHLREVVLIAIVLGLVSTSFDFAFFGFFVRKGEGVLQTMWFIGSVLTELALLFSIRTSSAFFKTRIPSVLVLGLTFLCAFLAIALPFSRFGKTLFSFVTPEINNLVIVLVLVVLYFTATELVKRFYYRIFTSQGERIHGRVPHLHLYEGGIKGG